MRRVGLLLVCAVLLGVAGCGGAAFECGTIQGTIAEVNSARVFSTAAGGRVEAEPGFQIIEVVVDPDEGYFPWDLEEEGKSWGCALDLVDAEGNRFKRIVEGWYGRTQQYKFHYQVSEGASGLQMGGTDLGL